MVNIMYDLWQHEEAHLYKSLKPLSKKEIRKRVEYFKEHNPGASLPDFEAPPRWLRKDRLEWDGEKRVMECELGIEEIMDVADTCRSQAFAGLGAQRPWDVLRERESQEKRQRQLCCALPTFGIAVVVWAVWLAL